MPRIKILAVAFAFCFAPALPVLGQVHERFEGWCDSLQNARPDDLVQFLKAVVPDEGNARCVTWTIHKLGKERYEPATPALVRLLDFHRPQTDGEKIFHGLSEEPFPAEVALELIGKRALPEVLRVIEADSTSEIARKNAVAVWMEIYKQSDEHAKALDLLRQDEASAKDNATKQKLRWALQEALKRCSPAERIACNDAASGRASPQ